MTMRRATSWALSFLVLSLAFAATPADAGYQKVCTDFLCASVGVGAGVTSMDRCIAVGAMAVGVVVPEPRPPVLTPGETLRSFHWCIGYGADASVSSMPVPVPVAGAGEVAMTGVGSPLPLACEGIGSCSDWANGHVISYDGLYCAEASFAGGSALGVVPVAASEGTAC